MMKNWKRIIALAMSAVMAGAMLTGYGSGGKTTGATKGDEPEAEAGVQAGKDAGEVTDSSEKKQVYVFTRDRGDLSYWDSMATGGDRAAADYADRVGVHVVETAADLQANLQTIHEAVGEDTDLIIAASDFKDSLVEIANKYPDIAFTITSENVIDQCENNNAYGVNFVTSQAAFLGGVAVADVAANGAEGMDPTNMIGFIGGMDEPLVIQKLLWDYTQGAQYYNPDIKVIYNYIDAQNNPDTARTQAMIQCNGVSVDVIFTCTGGSSDGVHNAAGKAQKLVIGMDSDQSQLHEDDKAVQEESLTSIVKEVGNAVYNVIGGYLDNGTLPYGEYEVLGLSDGAVSIVEGNQLNGALSDEDKVKLEEAKAGIADGSVEVKSAISKGRDEVKALTSENCQQGKKRRLIGMLEDWREER